MGLGTESEQKFPTGFLELAYLDKDCQGGI